MSIKENIEMVKDELNSEEKFFEKAVITERFVKKYKKPLIGALVAIVVLVSANIIYDSHKQNKIETANKAFLELKNNNADEVALKELKSNSPKLYEAWMLSQAVTNKDADKLKELKGSNIKLIKDIASYELAQLSKDSAKLDEYASKQNAIYKELAQIQSAVILLNENKIEKAHEKLSQIPIDSALNPVAASLMHYGVK